MVRRTDRYVDTSGFIAFLDHSEAHHALFAGLFSDPPPLVSTPLVVAEGHAWFLKRYDRDKAFQFLAFLDSLAPLHVLSTGPEPESHRGHRQEPQGEGRIEVAP